MSKQPLIDIRPDHLQIVQDILQKHVPNHEVWAFGSRVKWTARDYSDLDLCVISDQPLGFTVLGDLKDDFSESDLPWKVDVVDWATTSASFRKIIEGDKVVVQKVGRMQDVHVSYETNWQRLSLKDAGVILIDCEHRTPPATNSGYPYIAIPQIKNGHIQLDGVRRISPDHYAEWTRKLKPQSNDVIVVRRCRSGDTAFVPPGLKCAIWKNLVILRSNGKFVLPEFLRWLLRGPDWWEQVGKFINVGAVFDSLTCREIPDFELTIPPIKDQREIVGLLGALDDRITLLRETNATLEAIAQALFKSWFVDFDPVHAKQQGLAPEGMDEATAALFPDSFEESELGLVPKGWRICSFTDTIDVIGGGTPKTSISEYWNGSIPWFSVVDAPVTADVFVIDTEKHITESGIKNSSTKLLPAGTTIISARGTVGKLALTGRDMGMNQSCYGLRGKAGDDYFTYFSTCRIVETLKQHTHGSVFDTITRDTLSGISIVCPIDLAVLAFERLVSSVMERIRNNLEQARTLSNLRDTLLPRLISGQLRLPEAEAS